MNIVIGIFEISYTKILGDPLWETDLLNTFWQMLRKLFTIAVSCTLWKDLTIKVFKSKKVFKRKAYFYIHCGIVTIWKPRSNGLQKKLLYWCLYDSQTRHWKFSFYRHMCVQKNLFYRKSFQNYLTCENMKASKCQNAQTDEYNKRYTLGSTK